MHWKLVQGLFLLLWNLLTVDAGKQEIYETQVARHEVGGPSQVGRHEVGGPSQVVSFLAASFTNDSDKDGQEARVTLPSLGCTVDQDCVTYGDLQCSGGQCTCRPPTCWVYEYVVTGLFMAKNVFSCGECGESPRVQTKDTNLRNIDEKLFLIKGA
ncbi:hypothetical protein GWK47_036744 [Chionoecetes opilio]|uniref:Uncharacterized protein n=1 Tax=Chionoecetes opilio TaxID=41210 RepID=A0A8J4YE20_CHIOP|nr:hypothetical protein GWK47_036744 [Chionoecetes opilio]